MSLPEFNADELLEIRHRRLKRGAVYTLDARSGDQVLFAAEMRMTGADAEALQHIFDLAVWPRGVALTVGVREE